MCYQNFGTISSKEVVVAFLVHKAHFLYMPQLTTVGSYQCASSVGIVVRTRNS